MGTMDRKVLIAYLENLRNLETLRYHLNEHYVQLSNEVNDLEMRLELKKPVYVPSTEAFVRSVIPLVLLVAAFAAWLWGEFYKKGSYYGFILWMVGRTLPAFLIISAVFVFIVAVCPAYKDVFIAMHTNHESEKYNKRVNDSAGIIKAELARLNDSIQHDIQEYRKVQELLDEAYAFNILPSPYRNTESVFYIYDYMSTSNATLEDTLLHSHMQEGLQKICSILGVLIQQNMHMIRLMQIQTTQNATIMHQLSSIEADAKMISHFTKVNNYIAQANYLK